MPDPTQEFLDRMRERRLKLQMPAVEPQVSADTSDPDLEALLKSFDNPTEAVQPKIAPWRKWLATGARVGGSWLGALGAGALATPETFGFGTIPAAIAGGAAGGAAGEGLAEWIEGRPKFNPTQIAVQGAIGAVPMGKFLKGPLLPLVLKGAAAGGTSAGLTEAAETGKLPSMRTIEQGALLGGAGGAAFRGLEHLIPALRRLRAPNAEAEFKPTMSDAELGVEAAIPNRGSRQAMPPYRPSVPTPRRSAADIAFETIGRRGTPRPEASFPSPESVPGTSILDEVGGQRQFPRGATQQPRFDMDPQAPLPLTPRRPGVVESVLDEELPPQRSLEVLDPHTSNVNASGESAASMEALSRQRGMQGRGEKFVVFDRAGNRRELLGPDAVDYAVREGETFGVESASGFRKLDDRGGRVPVQSRLPASVRDVVNPPETVDTVDITPPFEQAPTSSARPRIPPKITALWQDLKPKWAESVAKQAGDQIPFTVDPTEDLIPFAKRLMSEDPRQLMGAERKVRAALDAATGGDEGNISPELLARIGLTAGGALAGSLIDEKHRGRGALAGAAVGLGGATALTSPALLERLRYFSLLSSPATQAKNVLGNVGAVGSRAAELALTGKSNRAASIVKNMFSGDTIERAREAFLRPGLEENRWGSTSGVLGIPGRVMGAMDEATKGALQRAGETPEQAAITTFTAEPRSDFGKGLTSFHGRGGAVARLLVPFARTATNILERGVERLPGVGYLPAVRKMTNATMGEATARQALGALAAFLGSKHGGDNPYLAALAGPYAVPFAAGSAMSDKKGKKKMTPSQRIQAGSRSVLNAAPLPPDAYTFNPGKFAAQYVPNLLSLLSETPPNEFDTSESILNPALAKIPILNEIFLKHKHGAALKRAREGR